MAIFDRNTVYAVETGKRARKLNGGAYFFGWGEAVVHAGSLGDGAWVLSANDYEEVAIGCAAPIPKLVHSVANGDLSRQYPYIVGRFRDSSAVLVQDPTELLRIVRKSGADMNWLFARVIDAMAYNSEILDGADTLAIVREALKEGRDIE